MQITDEECAEFVRLCREEAGVELTIDEARDAFARLLLLFETFAAWVAREREAGRMSEFGELRHSDSEEVAH